VSKQPLRLLVKNGFRKKGGNNHFYSEMTPDSGSGSRETLVLMDKFYKKGLQMEINGYKIQLNGNNL
jgi:hypothetical protein